MSDTKDRKVRTIVEPDVIIRFRNPVAGKPQLELPVPITLDEIVERFKLEGFDSVAQAGMYAMASDSITRFAKAMEWKADTKRAQMLKDLKIYEPVAIFRVPEPLTFAEVVAELKAAGEDAAPATVRLVGPLMAKAAGKRWVDDPEVS